MTLLIVVGISSSAAAQQRTRHYFHSADLPPGVVGQGQLIRETISPHHFQPVEIAVPEGVELSLATNGMFEPPAEGPLRVGMLVGQVYRLRITNIPFRLGQEVYPTVELINRLYPPPGRETRYPIPLQITRDEMEMALRGQYIVRVVYLEDPDAALPRQEDPQVQRYFDVGPGEDPLLAADQLGRPMAIVRLGSRTPEMDPSTGRFLFDSAPWMRYPEVLEAEPPTPDQDVAAQAAAYQKPLERPLDAKRTHDHAGVNR